MADFKLPRRPLNRGDELRLLECMLAPACRPPHCAEERQPVGFTHLHSDCQMSPRSLTSCLLFTRSRQSGFHPLPFAQGIYTIHYPLSLSPLYSAFPFLLGSFHEHWKALRLPHLNPFYSGPFSTPLPPPSKLRHTHSCTPFQPGPHGKHVAVSKTVNNSFAINLADIFQTMFLGSLPQWALLATSP